MTSNPSDLRKDWVRIARTQLRIESESATRYSIDIPILQRHKSFRAARLVDDTTRFVVVSVNRKLEVTREMMVDIIHNGLNYRQERWVCFHSGNCKSLRLAKIRVVRVYRITASSKPVYSVSRGWWMDGGEGFRSSPRWFSRCVWEIWIWRICEADGDVLRLLYICGSQGGIFECSKFSLSW